MVTGSNDSDLTQPRLNQHQVSPGISDIVNHTLGPGIILNGFKDIPTGSFCGQLHTIKLANHNQIGPDPAAFLP